MTSPREKNNPPQRRRQEYVYGTTKGEVSEISISIDPTTGEFDFKQDMFNTYTELSYDRSKGEKVLVRVPSKSNNQMFGINNLLFRDYDHIFAVDTATAFLGEEGFSVTAIVTTKTFFTVDSHGIVTREKSAFYYAVPFCFLYRRPEGNPETLGWCLLIEELLRSTAYRKCRSIGIIVDSELGLINDINARRAPLRGRLRLPQNMTLLYAADAVAETAPNHLIRVADAAATQMRDEVLAERILLPPSEVIGPPFKGHRKLIDRNLTVL